jgi:hypothetical protein
MSVSVLLAELTQAGVALMVRGDRLHVEAPAGSLTPILRRRLADNKTELLALLNLRAVLLTLAADELLPAALVHDLDDADVAACANLPDDTLRAYLRALVRGQGMDRGELPAEYTRVCHCDACGPVWLWPTCPDRVKACPWCFRRKAGRPFPQPAE